MTGVADTSGNDATRRWFAQRVGVWREVEQTLGRVDESRRVPRQTVLRTVRAYPEIARDLAIARRIEPTGRLTGHLEHLYASLHRALFRPADNLRDDLGELLGHEVPRITRAIRVPLAWVTSLFLASALAGWWLISSYPELVSLVASDTMIDKVQRGELWTEGLLNVMPSSILSVRIFTNNIVVALTVVCLGVFYGIGTVSIIALNGLMLGGALAITARYGLAGRLFEFVVPHGVVELAVVCVAGAVGLSLGEALIRPGQRSRAAAFQLAVRDAARLMAVCVVFLVGAGLIEGHVSPDPGYPLAARIGIGLGYLLVFVAVLAGRPRLAGRLRRGAAP